MSTNAQSLSPAVRCPAGTTTGSALRDAGITDAVVARDDNGVLHDLSWAPDQDLKITGCALDTPEGLATLRHSTAHVLAQAVQSLFPDAKLGIGPAVQDGFYYDFDVPVPFTPDDLTKIEAAMKKIVKAGQKFRRRVVEPDEARAELAGEPYKLELVEINSSAAADEHDVDGGELTFYENVHAHTVEVIWRDLCRGPHLPTTKYIPAGAYKLMRTAAAYWRGNEANPMLQRIYGTAWATKEQLDAHLALLAEAEKRDHRRLGVELDLFSFPEEIGSGLAVFHPKGGIVRREMEAYSRERHIAAGYDFVNTPHITKGKLFEVSQHLSWYKDAMYPPMSLDAEYNADGTIRKQGQDYYLKPMNCPMHNLIFRSRGRSYRELPLRLFEFGTVYRYEKSGVVHGLTRARGFTQDDAHIYCTKEQMPGELDSLLTFVLDLLRDYGLSDFYLELSTKDPVKFVGSDEVWEEATEILRQVAMRRGLELVMDPGGAAFYGPKISVQARDAIGRTWQMSTIQVDFNLPELFDLDYTAPDGSRQRPVMIHRALFGSVERFFAVLLEHYAGAFPAWLSPVQVEAIPVAERHVEYLDSIAERIRAAGLRVEVDDSDDRMQKKILKAQQEKVPFMLVAGDDDVAAGTVALRYRNGRERRGVGVDEVIAEIGKVVADRLTEPDALAQPAEK